MSDNVFRDIAFMHEFYKAYDAVSKMKPEVLKEFLKFRIGCIEEELYETKKAIEETDWDGVVDGIIDGLVFGIGTLDLFAVNVQDAWDAVLKANLNKSVGEKASRKNNFGFPDLIKKPGWIPPCHKDNVGILPNTEHQKSLF